MKSRRITGVFAVLLILCLTGSALVVDRVDDVRAGATLSDILYIPSSRALKRMSLGFNGLLADVYWTRAVQYFGSKHYDRAARYELLAPLLEITTDLDPHLIVAYQFGSIFLSQRPPEGAGKPEEAAKLVEKGIRENPNAYHLYFNLGWIQNSELKDYAAASSTFQRGSEVKGSPPAFKVLAAAMAQHGGDIATARFLWTQIYNTTEDKSIRANAIKRLQALRVDEEVPLLESVLQQYKRSTGRCPAKWSELQAVGWNGPILDPVGNPYRITVDCRIEVQDPDQLPFIAHGLPPGTAPSVLVPATKKQQEAVQKTIEQSMDKSQLSAPESKK
jgi:hypothetical protein